MGDSEHTFALPDLRTHSGATHVPGLCTYVLTNQCKASSPHYKLVCFTAANRACVIGTLPKDQACSLPCFAGDMLPAVSVHDTSNHKPPANLYWIYRRLFVYERPISLPPNAPIASPSVRTSSIASRCDTISRSELFETSIFCSRHH